ncbi:hypothetical protein R1sor_007149 [Riccia sorocarpa]|uniref:Glycosyl transferase 64 domain-containing protein n=1 Tax=Riccia sorocarpa TaxID=122646 RepID=A0ABD3HPK6_9MARC
MVGFVPRMHWPKKTKHAREQYTYGGWWSVWWTGTYSMILTKAAFIHKDYLDLYTSRMPSPILSYVKEERNCEDIAMSFLVANYTDAPPIWVKGDIHEIGSTGISSLAGHSKRRTACVNYFVDVFGRMPLVSTRVKIVKPGQTAALKPAGTQKPGNAGGSSPPRQMMDYRAAVSPVKLHGQMVLPQPALQGPYPVTGGNT